MTNCPSFCVVSSRSNTDLHKDLVNKLCEFGFIDIRSTYGSDINFRDISEYENFVNKSDVVIIILPHDEDTRSVLKYSVNNNKNVIIVGKNCSADDEEFDINKYSNVFTIVNHYKSHSIIYKNLVEIKNARENSELEQCDNRMQ